MRRFCVGLAGLGLFPAVSLADGSRPEGDRSGCGGDAYSFAEVVASSHSPQRGEPVFTLPDTLCADLAGGPATRIDSLSIYLDRRSTGPDQQPNPPRSRSPIPRSRF
jgi:hypothetical protein